MGRMPTDEGPKPAQEQARGREATPLLGREACPRLLYLLFISLMRLFPGSLITIIETIPFLTLFTAGNRKSL